CGNNRGEWRAEFVRQHGQEMVFGTIGGFHDRLLLLKLFLNAPSLGHTSRKCHRRNRQHRYPPLQGEKRLVLCFPKEWPEAMQRSPHRDRGQNEKSRGRFALGKAERGPNYNVSANERYWITSGRNFKPPAKDDAAQQHQQQEERADFRGFPFVPTPFWGSAPEKNQGSENKVARCIAEPPCQPNRAVVCPIGKAGEGKTGHTESRADDGANRCCEGKLENPLRTFEEVPAAGESIHQPGAGQRLERVTGGDGK